jgi:hypothetical protein
VIAPIASAHDHNVAFIVMLAGSGVPGDQLLVEQTRLIAETNGMSRKQADTIAAKEQSETDVKVADRKIRTMLAGKIPDAQLGIGIQQVNSPWFRYFINCDPATVLRQVTCPVLALTGNKDVQVPARQNLAAIHQALAQGGNKDFEVDEMPGLTICSNTPAGVRLVNTQKLRRR